MVLMGTQTTTTMSTKRSRRRTRHGTRGPRVVRDAALSPPTPAKAAIPEQPAAVPATHSASQTRVNALLLSRGAPRGDERTRRGAARITAGSLKAAALYRLMAWLSPAYPI